eukprot:GFKZ01008417.1.p1 GENE.GFKZ01008417.1~~GFKZ01008417.1.p1  ORF type:complete len:195 (+),score=0.81 GFKZ01008417.1:152-736(+)
MSSPCYHLQYAKLSNQPTTLVGNCMRSSKSSLTSSTSLEPSPMDCNDPSKTPPEAPFSPFLERTSTQLNRGSPFSPAEPCTSLPNVRRTSRSPGQVTGRHARPHNEKVQVCACPVGQTFGPPTTARNTEHYLSGAIAMPRRTHEETVLQNGNLACEAKPAQRVRRQGTYARRRQRVDRVCRLEDEGVAGFGGLC